MKTFRSTKRTYLGIMIIQLFLGIALSIGEIKCIVKAVRCNWNPIGKAEIIYTVGALSGAGVIIGYLNIEDN